MLCAEDGRSQVGHHIAYFQCGQRVPWVAVLLERKPGGDDWAREGPDPKWMPLSKWVSENSLMKTLFVKGWAVPREPRKGSCARNCASTKPWPL